MHCWESGIFQIYPAVGDMLHIAVWKNVSVTVSSFN